MEENTQEKNLIKKDEKSIFCRIKNFFKQFLHKKETPNTIGQEDTANVKNSNEFKEYIKMTEDEETKLLELQRKYRRGEIGENDLTDEQIDALCNLYDKQIEELKKSIKIKEEKIQEHKNRKQQRTENNNA